jgi:hypothetical protein
MDACRSPALDPLVLTREDLLQLRQGDREADACERALAWSARTRGAIDAALAEGLAVLQQGDRLPRLGCHLDDYGREVLDLGQRATEGLARLGRGLRTRSLLREALRSGRVGLRAAQTVLEVATGEEERAWVERAERLTVRELEALVRRAGAAPEDEDEPWYRLQVGLADEERELFDEALELAGELRPGASRLERLEAMAQELASALPEDPDLPDDAKLHAACDALRRFGPEASERAARLEGETERWACLPEIGAQPAVDVSIAPEDSAEEVDRKLRALAGLRAQCEDLLGSLAAGVKASGLWRLLGFATFRQYVVERLRLPPRSVEQRAAVEERLWRSPGLQEGRRQRLTFEKLRLLSRLPEPEVKPWLPRAHALTCIALRRALEGEEERQLRARRQLRAPLPLRLAALLAGVVHAVRAAVGGIVTAATCLTVMAAHFVEVWGGSAPRKTRSRKVRERDEGSCQVPGCSRRAEHAHHVTFRSQGGGDDLENQASLCGFHHLRCVHGGFLAVTGRAPDGLRWFLGGVAWEGPRP